MLVVVRQLASSAKSSRTAPVSLSSVAPGEVFASPGREVIGEATNAVAEWSSWWGYLVFTSSARRVEVEPADGGRSTEPAVRARGSYQVGHRNVKATRPASSQRKAVVQ